MAYPNLVQVFKNLIKFLSGIAKFNQKAAGSKYYNSLEHIINITDLLASICGDKDGHSIIYIIEESN